MTETATEALAGFLTGRPSGVAQRRATARLCLLDTIGSMLFGSRTPWSRAAAAFARAQGADRGPCAVVGAGWATTAAMAAFANGAAAHGFELDDVHEEAISHPGAVCVPVALAVAADLQSARGRQGASPAFGSATVSGADLLDAIVVGYEAMGRAGIAVGAPWHMRHGFHPTGQSGVFGAAATAGHLLGLDAERLTAALGIAATFASGLTEFTASGGDTKRLHAGRAAEGGLTAAYLAAAGFEGPAAGLDGRYGFCRVTSPQPALHLLLDALGERWMIDEITIKPFASCSDVHPLIEAAQQIRAEGVHPGRISSIVAHASSKAVEQNAQDGTVSVMAAQYSAPFNIAAAFVADPADPDTYHPSRIAAGDVAALQAKVQPLRADPAYDATYAWKMSGRLEVTMVDGTTITRAVEGQKGSMHNPLTADEVEAKLTRVASVGAGHRHQIIAAVRDLESSAHIGGLLTALAEVPELPPWP